MSGFRYSPAPVERWVKSAEGGTKLVLTVIRPKQKQVPVEVDLYALTREQLQQLEQAIHDSYRRQDDLELLQMMDDKERVQEFEARVEKMKSGLVA